MQTEGSNAETAVANGYGRCRRIGEEGGSRPAERPLVRQCVQAYRKPVPYRHERRQRWRRRLVERLLVCLVGRMAQAGLFHIHVLACDHVGWFRMHGRGQLIVISQVQSWARIGRHSELHEQYAKQQYCCGNQSGCARKSHGQDVV